MQSTQAVWQTSGRYRFGGKLAMIARARLSWCREWLFRLALVAAAVALAAATAWLALLVRQDIENGRPRALSLRVQADAALPGAVPPRLTPVATRAGASIGGYTIWHDGLDGATALADATDWGYAEASVGLLLADSTRGYDHVFRFYRQRDDGGSLLASVFLAETGRTAIELPRGVYSVELVTRPAGTLSDAASVLNLPGHRVGLLDLTLPSSSYRLGPMLLIADYRRTTFIPGVLTGAR